MREIKFRAWDRNGDGMFYNIQTGIQFEDGSAYTFDKFITPDIDDAHEWEIMQFTGLHDKNGKEIYEGDIVHCSIEGDDVGNIDVVGYKDASFWLRYRDRSIESWIEFGNELEVIGNIYEHKHLLK